MKSTVRRRQWIGLILAVLLMLPLSGIAAAAEDAGGEAGEPSLMEQLGWKTDAAYPGTTCTLSITDDFGAEGNRSLHLNFEMMLLVFDREFVHDLSLLQRSYERRSSQLNARFWHQRSRWQRFLEGLCYLGSPLL